jgi:hypothetical protein
VSRLLHLPDNLYERLERAAAAAKTTPIEWLDRHIPQRGDLPEARPGSLYDLIKDHIGVFDSGGGIKKMPEDPNDALFNILLEKKRKGTL